MTKKNNGLGKFIGGIALGVGLGVLFAPASGKETRRQLKNKVEGKNVSLRIIQVEGDSASDVYVRNKMKAGLEVGLDIQHILLDNDVPTSQILGLIDVFNNDNSVNGIMVQLPLPKHLDEDLVINSINPEKDVDGFHPVNVGKLALGQDTFVSCTPYGIIKMLEEYQISIEGKNAVVIRKK